jgi:predicted transcriptional regulator
LARERELPPPLEMICLNALWEIHEGNVEDVRKVVSQNRPLAYTTVLTLLDRLARRGAVARRKEGRGFRYQPVVARDKLRRLALRQFLEYHFDGSEAKLKVFLEQPVESSLPESPSRETTTVEPSAAVTVDEDPAVEANMAAFAAVASGREPRE